MANRIILCSACGAKNRLEDQKGQPYCGKCGKALSVRGYRDSVFTFSRLVKAWPLLFVFGFFYFYSTSHYSENLPQNAPSRAGDKILTDADLNNIVFDEPVGNEEISVKSFNAPPVSITHGVVEKNYRGGVAPLAIKTSAGINYFIKVVNANTQQTALTAYIIGGKPLEIQVPLGAYEIRYASGNTWYGSQYLFGPETRYSKADKIFNFQLNGNRYSGYTIELISRINGNLGTSSINSNAF